MSEYGKEFTKSFFERTHLNLKQYQKNYDADKEKYPYDVTQLINSFLGLIVFIKEDKEDKEIFKKVCSNEKLKQWERNFDYINNDTRNKNPKNLKQFLRRMRNSVCHGSIEAKTIEKDGKREICGLKFEDKNPKCPECEKDKFEAELTIEQLNKFINCLSEALNENIAV